MCHLLYAVPPMMWVPAQQLSVYYGDDATLVCVVEAHPEALVYWEFDGQMVQEVSSSGIEMSPLSGPPKYKVSPSLFKNLTYQFNSLNNRPQ